MLMHDNENDQILKLFLFSFAFAIYFIKMNMKFLY